MISSPDRCPSALGGAQQDSDCAVCLTEGGWHISIIKGGSWGQKETHLHVKHKYGTHTQL